MLPLISTTQEALSEIRSFTKHRAKYSSILAHARAWYACKSDDEFAIGPSKVIGYRGMTPDLYFKHTNTHLDGRVTESALQSISTPVVAGSQLHNELLKQLSELCASFGTKPNKLVRFAMIGDVDEIGETDRFAELLAGAYIRMAAKEQNLFRKMTGLRG